MLAVSFAVAAMALAAARADKADILPARQVLERAIAERVFPGCHAVLLGLEGKIRRL
ncbi:MAG: hypothetical protein HY721_00405 [Planctomycetes bacterium]|nr:hypothetical protein [Planctomycetota bacterium]